MLDILYPSTYHAKDTAAEAETGIRSVIDKRSRFSRRSPSPPRASKFTLLRYY